LEKIRTRVYFQLDHHLSPICAFYPRDVYLTRIYPLSAEFTIHDRLPTSSSSKTTDIDGRNKTEATEDLEGIENYLSP